MSEVLVAKNNYIILFLEDISYKKKFNVVQIKIILHLSN